MMEWNLVNVNGDAEKLVDSASCDNVQQPKGNGSSASWKGMAMPDAQGFCLRDCQKHHNL